MRIYLLVLILISSFLTHLQSQIRASKTYALVIGVSKYEDPKITALKYAHQDATAFSDLCLSPSGLNIPLDQVRILTDEKASYWNIVDGLDWLKSKALKDDQIYIYFAGHGDMESKELKYGYLLAHDSRYMNYLGRSLSLDLLNKTAHTLTVDKKAKVFLITDACHSGKLAGVDFNGSNLVALNLMQLVSNNEVRITSCNEGELSYESEIWGNGRGAFSYFLTRGMSGEADGVNGKKDGAITIGEIKSFLSGKVPNEVRTVKSKKQNPIIMGTETLVLNQFKPSSNIQSSALSEFSAGSNTTEEGSRSVSALVDNTLEADILNAVNSKLQIDFAILSTKTKKEIINELLDKLDDEGKYTKETLYSSATSVLVAKTLYDKVQYVIDLYLSGDEAELEKRRYYNQVDKPYDQYPYMIDIAIKLLPKKHILIPSLQMQREYLTGLSYRLKVPFTEDYLILIDSAYNCQQRALALDNKAAYIHNEIGILELYKNNYEQSKYHFERANTIAPLWALPYANLASLCLRTKDDISAKKYVDQAIDRQQNLQNPYITDGSIYMNADNLLFAEEQYQRAIKINSRHFLPFEKLGALYLKLQHYESSNHYYYESELRKLGLVQVPWAHIEDLNHVLLPRTKSCTIDSTKVDPTDIMAHFVVGKNYFDINDYPNAQRWFEKVVKLDVENPLVYHYLGQTAYYFKAFDKAEFYFKKAIDIYLPDTTFVQHASKMASKSSYLKTNKDDLCLYETYLKAHFNIYDPNIYLAKTYEKWGNFISASEQYNVCILMDASNKLAYNMLWNLQKIRNELESAENTIQRLGKYHPDLLDNVLADFYKWILFTFREDLRITELYSYKYGLLMHRFMQSSPDEDWGESLELKPDIEIKDFENNFGEFIFYEKGDENDKLIHEVVWREPNKIEKPLSSGVNMFKKVVSISVNNNVKADAYAKMGDIYIRAKSNSKALENYENCLNISGDDIGIRSVAADCADQLYLFRKAFNHLTILKDMNGLGFEDAMLLARYYMRLGERDQAVMLSDKMSSTHPDLSEEIEEDVINLYLRFGEYQKALDLLNIYLEDWETDMIIEYALARSYAGLNKPEESLKHLQNAEKLGFDLGFVYKNDVIFDPYRSLNQEWTAIGDQMEIYVSNKMAPHKNNLNNK